MTEHRDVVVIGAGQAGTQIAKELHESGRGVYLSVGKAAKAPRRYRGKDIVRWTVALGGLEAAVDSLDSPADRCVGGDAKYVADHILNRLEQSTPST